MLRRVSRCCCGPVSRTPWLLAVATAAVLAGCRFGTQLDDADCEPLRESLAGSWRSGCLFLGVRPNDDDEDENIFFREVLTFDGRSDFTREYREFADGDCVLEAERLVIFADGGYNIGDNFVASSDGLDVCEIDFAYDEVREEVDTDDVFEEPDTPFDIFDIVYLLPEPDDEDGQRTNLYLGDLEGPFIENAEDERPDALDFDVVYERL